MRANVRINQIAILLRASEERLFRKAYKKCQNYSEMPSLPLPEIPCKGIGSKIYEDFKVINFGLKLSKNAFSKIKQANKYEDLIDGLMQIERTKGF
jgi:hypothetical protein